MDAPIRESSPLIPAHLTLGVRLGITALALTLEALLLQLLVEATPAMPTTGLAAAVHDVQHWLIRFLVAYAVACVMLFSLGRRGSLASIGASHSGAPIRLEWLIVHGLSLLPFALLSSLLYADKAQLPFIALATLWHPQRRCDADLLIRGDGAARDLGTRIPPIRCDLALCDRACARHRTRDSMEPIALAARRKAHILAHGWAIASVRAERPQ
jgi:hypothetical protein